jgi:hypothetical protein
VFVELGGARRLLRLGVSVCFRFVFLQYFVVSLRAMAQTVNHVVLDCPRHSAAPSEDPRFDLDDKQVERKHWCYGMPTGHCLETSQVRAVYVDGGLLTARGPPRFRISLCSLDWVAHHTRVSGVMSQVRGSAQIRAPHTRRRLWQRRAVTKLKPIKTISRSLAERYLQEHQIPKKTPANFDSSRI